MVFKSLIELPVASKYAGIEFGVVFEPLFTYTAKICKKGSHFAQDGYFSLFILYNMGITLWSGIPLPNNIMNASGAVREPKFTYLKTL